MKLPTITVFQGRTDFFGKSMEVEVEVNPDNLHPFFRRGYYGLCTACGAHLEVKENSGGNSPFYEQVSKAGRRYYCGDCVDYLLSQ